MKERYRQFISANSVGNNLNDDIPLPVGSTVEVYEKLASSMCAPKNFGPSQRIPAIILKTEKISLAEIDPSHIQVAPALKLTQVSEESDSSKSLVVLKHYVVSANNAMYFDIENTPIELLTVVYEISPKDKESSENQRNRKCVIKMLGKNYGIVLSTNMLGLPFVVADEPVKPKDKEEAKNKFDKNKTASLKKAKQTLEELPPGAKRSREEELRIFQEYSGDRSNNPRKIDIVTEKIEGVMTTMSRSTMPKLKLFFKLMKEKIAELKKIGEGDIPMPYPVYGESFRISTKHATPRQTKGGKFRSGRHTSIHNYGNACDIRLPKRFIIYSTAKNEFRENYINLFVHCAQLAGFIRIGISTNFVHVDTGEQESGSKRPPVWWVYPKADLSPQKKRAYINKRLISKDWLPYAESRTDKPKDLTGLDYTKLVYTTEGLQRTNRSV